MKYFYNIYGLTARTNFKLGVYPETEPSAKVDFVIKKGKVNRPKDGLEKTVYKPYSVLNKDLYYLHVTDIAKYKVVGNHSIVMEKHTTANWQDVFAFLFDSIFTVMLIKHDIFVFHATAVAFGRKAILFCGAGGIGKSTLAASLVKNKKGRIIEDDKCLLSFNAKTNAIQIKNQFPFIELWQPNTGFVKDRKDITPVSRVRKNIPKIRFDIKQHVPKRNVTLDKIVLLNMSNTEDKIDYNQITGIQKVNVVKNYTHMHHFLSIFGKNKAHFKAIGAIVNGIEVHSINKSRLTPLPAFIKFIEDEII